MKVEILKIGQVEESKLKFAVISTRFQNKWVFVRHKDRDTWEIPGGHREIDENINDTAKRELFEETGAKIFKIEPVCDYSVTKESVTSFGRLFISEVSEFTDLPNLEIGELRYFNEPPSNLTYPDIQPYLYEQTILFLDNSFNNMRI
ncbi:ADP-ribose pyrophosphatase [Gottschalkia purinilytica]|uniref:ADP-ribose pyrophosphatase n=1 Tax=Gottschalkia purinilytica TaxID=1503 RepID=A0A0L0WAX8_GOTPU|nr:NUDIX domain-containing protein [Gottschalkia purinilytica]KNF08612.1 ADP-ribose pyrophosphatase [Gottschalkia purinilytica]